MSMNFQFNVAATRMQRYAAVSTLAMNSSSNKLSTGYKINQSKDDAAGLQISNKLKAQIRGASQAIQNAQDGINLLAVGESALTTFTNTYQRIRELTLQAANGTQGTTQRSSINQEIKALQAEIDRIAKSTTFAGKNIFDPQTQLVNGTATEMYQLQYNGYYNGDPTNYYDTGSYYNFAGGWDSAFDGNYYYIYLDESLSGLYEVNGKKYNEARGIYNSQSGNSFYLDFVNDDGFGNPQDYTHFELTLNTQVTVYSTPVTTKLQVGSGANDYIDISGALGESNIPNLVGSLGSTDASARFFLSQVDSALTTLGKRMALYGTFRNKLENVVTSQEVIQTNLESANSRIRDVDVAKESAKFTQAQILRQSTTNLLSQANISPEVGLNLLRSSFLRN